MGYEHHTTSQPNHSGEAKVMILDFMFVLTIILLVGTSSALFLYFKRITRANIEYEKAKGIVENIVISIDHQFKRQKNRILFFADKIENIILENKKIEKKIEEYDNRIIDLTQKIDHPPNIENNISGEINKIKNEIQKLRESFHAKNLIVFSGALQDLNIIIDSAKNVVTEFPDTNVFLTPAPGLSDG